ncbi:MAG: ATP-dependent DNA helicase [Verrucomicrobiota bacterium]
MISLRDMPEEAVSVPDLPGLVARVFGKTGWLVEKHGLEYRQEQEAMALRVAEAFCEDRPLIFEAGTGTGKSLAYLVPGIIHAVAFKRPLVVSSHTIALQEQLKRKDLVICRELFASIPELNAFAEFETALLVGRGNYLCTTRLARALGNISQTVEDPESAEIKRIAAWAQETETGLQHEMVPKVSPEVWDMVSADSSTCSRKNCDPQVCFYQKAKSEIARSHVRILNHSLLFALLNAGMSAPSDKRGILFPEDTVVLDEAHTIPAIATDHIGNAVSSFAFNLALNRLYNPQKDKGFLKKHGNRKILNTATDAIVAIDQYFSDIHTGLLDVKSIVRLYQPNWSDMGELVPIPRLINELGSLEGRIQDENALTELRDHRRRLKSLYEALIACNEFKLPEHVYWVERAGKRNTTIHVRSAPIDVAPYLKEYLFDAETGCLMTSATLAAGKDMLDFAQKVGGEESEMGQVLSPFDYDQQVEIRIARKGFLSQVQGRSGLQTDISGLSAEIVDSVGLVEGGALVLFTNYRDMQQCAMMCERNFSQMGRALFVQGQSLSRSEMVDQFKQLGNAVIFGTDSFWTGIDVPGKALEQLIMTKLPFENPSHPVQEAKVEWVESQGGNPFMQISIPDAVIKFRQGMGRLIRSRSDSGLITILDNRVLNKPYGKYFIGALPKKEYSVI